MSAPWEACDFAACDKPGTHPGGGWWFCESHLRVHVKLEAEENPTDRDDRIVALALRGYSDQEIAAMVDLDRSTIIKIRVTAGVRRERSRPECGTRGGHHQHRRRQEPSCESCKQAEADYYAQRWARKQAEIVAGRVPRLVPARVAS